MQDGEITKGTRVLKFFNKGGFLFIQLPSGRKPAYAKVHIEEGKYGDAVFYECQSDKLASTKQQQAYGSKLVENIVQAASDILAEGCYI
ncbi:hypothetical protein P7D85_11030 [Enterococcus hulanensis]|uniref:DUF4176 domain-containing protein n=1 Tax=Enterococcus hulanensis TaxID=2559929 RepID=A0ABU3EZJ8_9ENTE|nr:hypothetical protein [Enterococcus hulanensis]MDT2600310.1 hypothetical protein [Enterococcus hulanensis]MDT2609123.1 hypothetical protein [Enterococcus hulanensis]MDT2616835.1 hypothetical protein [Enterococcus hulanensis]MDT2628645.1 hypothetical protein [Enterococcus hulanensis]MDT2655985.1 hypothetical protein [Enterococcus hulanensis]